MYVLSDTQSGNKISYSFRVNKILKVPVVGPCASDDEMRVKLLPCNEGKSAEKNCMILGGINTADVAKYNGLVPDSELPTDLLPRLCVGLKSRSIYAVRNYHASLILSPVGTYKIL